MDLPPLRPSTPPVFLRKRNRSSSSEAPIFSSDDLADATSENYTSPRRKRQHRKPWWTGQERRKPKRAIDSGVWLSSDASTDDGFDEAFKPQSTQTTPRAKLQETRDYASQIIQACVEMDQETIDLSSLGLTTLSNSTIRPLHNIIRPPKSLPTEQAYHSFRPSLQIFLASNSLLQVPSELFHLQNLTVLSLRNNRLSTLPPSIGRLVNLQELNLVGNEFRWLPWEVLNLLKPGGKLTTLHTRPNPFLVPMVEPRETLTLPLDPSEMQASGARGSYTHLMSIICQAGQTCTPIFLGHTAVSRHGHIEPAIVETLTISPIPHTPSLFDIVLKSCSKSPHLHEIQAVAESFMPETVVRALDHAITAKDEGGRVCSVCLRDYIVPRTEWIEYWHLPILWHRNIPSDELGLPFLRQGCSPTCCPRLIFSMTTVV